MGVYDIPAGTENWDVPLNANLDAIDGRLTNGENKNTTQDGQIATLQGDVASNTADIATANSNIAANATAITGKVSKTGDTMSGALDMGSNKITSVASGTANFDAVNVSQVVLRSTEVFDVKHFGATGNGTTDDTTNIQNAINAATAGGTVYFPPGTYRLNGAALTIPVTGTQIRGAGVTASTILIDSGFTGTAAFTTSVDNVVFQDLSIHAVNTNTTSNPAASGIIATAAQGLKLLNVNMRYINAYAVKVFASAANTIHGGEFDNLRIQSCAGGIYLKGDNASGNTAANFLLSNIFTRFTGFSTGSSANLDCIRIEDAWDVLGQNLFTWMNATTGGTGVALRVVGNCAATFITNLDALGPQTGSANVSIEGNVNGSPQNVQITGGVIQQGIVGLNVQDAATQVRVVSVRFINNQTHGATISTSGPAIYFDGCFFSGSGAGATGTNYDLNWSGTTTGFVNNCRFSSAIVATGTAGVQQSVNVAAGQNVRFFNADFQGTNAARANYFTNLPVYAHTATLNGGKSSFLTDVDFSYTTGAARVAIQPFAAGNNCLATNVQGADTNDRFRLLGSGAQQFGPGNAVRDTTWDREGVATIGTPDSDISIGLAGKTLKVKSGTNAKAGTTAAMTAGSVTVSTTAVTANSVIVASLKTAGGTVGAPFVGTITPGTSFVLKSTSGSDTSVYNWIILEVN